MKQRMVAGVAVLTAAAVLAAPGATHAQTVAPQPNTPCSEDIAGAFTQLPDLRTFLECRDQPGLGYRWQILDSPYPNSDKWVTYGPTLTLHGEGQRNREIDSGDWIGSPRDADGRCTAKQQALAPMGGLSPPQISTGEPGQPLQFEAQPLLFTIELTGNCRWQKAP